MKSLIASFFLALFLVGCATEKQVTQMEGRGRRQVFPAAYDSTWRAAIDAAQVGGLQVRYVDKTSGYIAAHRGMTWATHGENVGIWVKPVTQTETQVEVVSRQAAPPKFWMKNWEDDVLTAIGANLTRDAAAAPSISEPAGVEIQTAPPAPPVAPPVRVAPEPPLPPGAAAPLPPTL